MITKVKIRKIDSTVEEVFDRIEELLVVSEKIPGEPYLGTLVKTICTSLGIKELEFWELKHNNSTLFKQQFTIRISRNFPSGNFILRKSKYEELFHSGS